VHDVGHIITFVRIDDAVTAKKGIEYVHALSCMRGLWFTLFKISSEEK
jgi:hypothetical protein